MRIEQPTECINCRNALDFKKQMSITCNSGVNFLTFVLLLVGWLIDSERAGKQFSVMLGRSHRFLGITSTLGR